MPKNTKKISFVGKFAHMCPEISACQKNQKISKLGVEGPPVSWNSIFDLLLHIFCNFEKILSKNFDNFSISIGKKRVSGTFW